MNKLKALEHVCTFSFFPSYFEHRIHKFSALRIVSLGKVVTSTRVTVHVIIRSKKLTECTCTQVVDRSRF